jgi:hypothetical protein
MPHYNLFSRNEVLCAICYMTATLCTDLLEKRFHSCVFLTVSDVPIKQPLPETIHYAGMFSTRIHMSKKECMHTEYLNSAHTDTPDLRSPVVL